MLITERKSPVIEKTEELCQTILAQPSFQEIRAHIDAFTADAEAQNLYQELVDLQEELQAKQRRGVALAPDEITQFESGRDALFANPVGKAFVDAQQQLHALNDSINKYVSKTFELGRMPTEEDLTSGGGCCGGGGGGGCGCK